MPVPGGEEVVAVDEVELVAGGADLHHVLDLTAEAFAASRQAATAVRLVTRCGDLADVTADLAVTDEAVATIASIHRAAKAAARCSDTCATYAREAGLGIPSAVQVFASPMSRSHRGPPARKVQDAVARCRRSLAELRRHAAVVGRLGAGLAARHPELDDEQALWEASRRLLSSLPLPEEELWAQELADGERAWVDLAGLVAHASWQRISTVSVAADDGAHRWIRVVYDDAVHVECISDTFLPEDERLTDEQVAGLERAGLRPPDDDHVFWWHTETSRTVGEVTTQVLDVVTSVYGIRPGGAITVWIGQPPDHPDLLPPEADPTVLDVERPSVPRAAAALAERLQLGIDAVGIDAVRVFVHQGRGWDAHLVADGSGNLLVQLASDPRPDTDDGLTDYQKDQLLALGWIPPTRNVRWDLESATFTRVWDAPFDVELACWHLMVSVAAVCYLDPDIPIYASVRLSD